MKSPQKKWLLYGFRAFLILILLAGIIVALVLTAKRDESKGGGAIATNGIECAAIGKAIAQAGGSAGDVAVATIICEGITCPQSRLFRYRNNVAVIAIISILVVWAVDSF